MKRIVRLFCLLPALGLFACQREAGDRSTVPLADTATQAKVYSDDAWLRERLPADSIVYVRIPSPWRMALGPGGKDSDRMFQSQAWVDAAAKVRAAFTQDKLIGDAAQPIAGLLYRLGTPVELVVTADGRMASPAALVYATARFDYADAATLGKAIAAQLGDDAQLAFDADGFASLPTPGAPVFLHFDAASGRLSLLGGMFANLDSLKKVRAEIAAAKVEPRAELALERRIDAAGHGFVVWADVEALRPVLGAAVTDDVGKLLLAQTKRVAFGWGAVDGRGKAGLHAEISGASWAQWLPQSPRKLDLKGSGRTRWLMRLAIPTGEDLARIGQSFAKDSDAAKGWAEVEAKSLELTGFKLVDWLAPFGPDLAVVSDDAGDYLALRLRDAAAWQRMQTMLVDKLKAQVKPTARGEGLHHIRLPSAVEMGGLFGDTPAEIQDNLALQVYGRLGTHLYWIEQDGWLLLSGVPQPLIDRLALGASEPLDARLRAAGADPESLMAVSGVAQDASRQIYYAWVGMLASIAELGGADIDLTTLPTARELALPEQSAISASLQLSAERLSLEMGYDQHALEWLAGNNGLAVVAVGGVLAAIAIPAYQDFTVRAVVASAIGDSGELSDAIAAHYAEYGELPDEGEALNLELPIASETGHADISYDHGAVLIQFRDTAPGGLAGNFLYRLPLQQASGAMSWRCGDYLEDEGEMLVELGEEFAATNVANRHLPVSCRAP